jgi:hypothetical protein
VGKLFLESGHSQDSAPLFENALQIEPVSSEVRYTLASAYLQCRQPGLALSLIPEAENRRGTLSACSAFLVQRLIEADSKAGWVRKGEPKDRAICCWPRASGKPEDGGMRRWNSYARLESSHRSGQSPTAGQGAEYSHCGLENRSSTQFEFLDLMARTHVSVVCPDIGGVGGLAKTMRVRLLAAQCQLKAGPHLWKTGISVAPATHVPVATPHCPRVSAKTTV